MPDRTIANASPTFERRFWAKVHKTDTCWLWTATKTPKGYGWILLCSGPGWQTSIYAHRASWELHRGPIPDGLFIDHLCRNTSCVNPDHLEPVTNAVNIRRGNGGQWNRVKTRCPQGHAYTSRNARIEAGGGRRCRKCDRVRSRENNPVRAVCHPDRPHCAKGLCRKCYMSAWETNRSARGS